MNSIANGHAVFRDLLTSREIWIRFDLIDLPDMPFAVRGDEENKLIAVHLANRPVHDVITQSRS